MRRWKRLIVSWINILKVLPSHVSNLKDILGTKFFHNFLREVCGEVDSLDSTIPQNHAIVEFLRDIYPNFEVNSESLDCDEEELVMLMSLLLFHSTIIGSERTREKMCRQLDEATQVLVKIFLERLIPLAADDFTRDKVLSAILEAESNKSLEPNETACFSSSPKPKTLQTFLETPSTLHRKVVVDKCEEIGRLKRLLNIERCGKFHLEEELATRDQKLKLLRDKYEQCVTELNKLKTERWLNDCEEPKDLLPQKPDICKEQKDSALVSKLKNRIDEIEEGNCMLNQENEDLKKQVKAQSVTITSLKLEIQEHLRECDRLGEEMEVKNGQINTLAERCQDLEKLVEETKASEMNPRSNLSAMSFTGEVEDLGSTVIDLKLCEEKEKNRALSEKLAQLEVNLKDLNTVRAQNSSLLEQCKKFRQLVDAKNETESALGELLAAQESSFRGRLTALGSLESCAERAWCSLSLEALDCARCCLVGRRPLPDLREAARRVRLFQEREDAHQWYSEKLRRRFKLEYASLRKQLDAKDAQLAKATDTMRSLRAECDADLLSKATEYNAKMAAVKAAMKEAYNAEVTKLSGESEAHMQSLRGRLNAAQSLVEELKTKYRQLAMEKRALHDELLRAKRHAERDSDVACAAGGEDSRARRRTTRPLGTFLETDEQGAVGGEGRARWGTVRSPDEEVFSSTHLSDLREGVCVPEHDRLGELRYRNSLCLPHLKSSYPAETQFLDPNRVTEEDLMKGLSKEPEDPARRKDRSYKKT